MSGFLKITATLIGLLVSGSVFATTPSAQASNITQSGACHLDVCVGQRAYNILRDYREVQVVGIESNGTYVLRFLDNGGVGGNWSRSDLALQRGCGNGFCVGDTAYNIQRQYRSVRVVGIHYDGKLVLRFDDNGGVGGNWADEDLVRTQGNPPSPQPQPPYPPYPPYPPQPQPPQGDYTVSGAGINWTQSPDQACYNRYRTRAVAVIARGQRYSCTAETCGHPYDWSWAYCSRY